MFDPITGLLAVAVRDPNRLLLLDGGTGEVRDEVALPGHARHLQLAAPGGPVLVPGEDSNQLIEVFLPGGEVRTSEVGDYPHDAAQLDSGLIVVGDEMGGTLSVVQDGAVIRTFDDLTQPGGVAALGERVAVIDVADFSLSLYDVPVGDVAAGGRVDRVSAGEGPTHLIVDNGGTVRVVDTRGDALLSFRGSDLQREWNQPLPGAPYGMAYDEVRDILWVTLTALNEVVGFDVSDDEPREVARFPTVRQPNTVAVDSMSGSVFVASRTTGQLQTIQT